MKTAIADKLESSMPYQFTDAGLAMQEDVRRFMPEPESALSDATNIALRIERDRDSYVLNGKKWFSSGAMAERCRVFIVMGKTDPNASRHRQQSMIVVPKDTPGISFGREPTVFG